MEKFFKYLTVVAVVSFVACFVVGCLSTTGHIDWDVIANQGGKNETSQIFSQTD